jgi:hypothetical protein
VDCLDRVPNLEMKLGNYIVRDTFYVVDLSDTDVVLGVHWMIALEKITTNYQTLEMGFRDRDGKKVVLRVMSKGEDIYTWGGSICRRMLDHYLEGFGRSTTIPYKDQEFIGTTLAGL